MTYRVRVDDVTLRDIEQFVAYLSDYSEAFALAESPTTWNYFYLTGAPYRAYLFRVGRRTQFWIIYTIDEEAKIVDVLRLWNAAKDPEDFRI